MATTRKSRKSRKSLRGTRGGIKSRAKACKARYSRKSKTSGYARFVKSEWKKHYKGDAKAAMKSIARAWRKKCHR